MAKTPISKSVAKTSKKATDGRRRRKKRQVRPFLLPLDIDWAIRPWGR